MLAALTLTLGIGCTTGLYALTRVLLADLPGIARTDRLGRIYASSPALGVERSQVALPEFDASLSKATSFTAIGAYADADAVLGTGQNARPVIAGYVSPAFFQAMGVPPVDGRVFDAADLERAQPPVILSHALWRREFRDQRLANATVVVDGVEHAVAGVMPPEFHYEFVGITADLWLPLGKATVKTPAIVNVYARLRDGVSWSAAAAELTALSTRGSTISPQSRTEPSDRIGWMWRAFPIDDDTRHRAIGAYAGTLGPALLVLLIACLNVACMLMARGIERDKELTVRRALGATRARVVRLLLVENAVLALISGALGCGFAIVVLRLIAAQLAAVQPSLASRLAGGASLLPIALATSALACLIFGTVPALRLSKRDVAASLKGVPTTFKIEIAGYGARDAIVFVELASAAGLIVWTAMLYTLFSQIGAITVSFAADRVVAMRVPTRTADDVATRVAAVPGVARVTISSGMLGGGDHVRSSGASQPIAWSRIPVRHDFLETLGVPMVRGRSFSVSEDGRTPVAIVGESGARRLAADGNVLGRHLALSDGTSVEVIGVARDTVDYGALSSAGAYALAEMYVPYDRRTLAPEAVVIAQLATDPHAALRAIAAAAQTPAGARPPRPVVLSDEYRGGRGTDGAMVLMRILGWFSALTLLLAASGIFAVIGQSIAQRTREFGIRIAVGATPGRVLAMVLARETKLLALAIGIGLAFTVALTNALFVELVRLNAIVPGLWLGALGLAGTTAALALALATYRIVRLQPAAVLRRT